MQPTKSIEHFKLMGIPVVDNLLGTERHGMEYGRMTMVATLPHISPEQALWEIFRSTKMDDVLQVVANPERRIEGKNGAGRVFQYAHKDGEGYHYVRDLLEDLPKLHELKSIGVRVVVIHDLDHLFYNKPVEMREIIRNLRTAFAAHEVSVVFHVPLTDFAALAYKLDPFDWVRSIATGGDYLPWRHAIMEVDTFLVLESGQISCNVYRLKHRGGSTHEQAPNPPVGVLLRQLNVDKL